MPARLVQVTLHNNTGSTVRWITDGLEWGAWQSPWFPSRHATIPPGQSGTWRSESDGILTGTEGWAWWGVDESDGTQFAKVTWDRPYIGSFGFGIGVTRADPTVAAGSSTFTDPRPPTIEFVAVDLRPMGGQQNVLGQLASAGVFGPLVLWSDASPGTHVQLAVSLRKISRASPLIQEGGRTVRAVASHSGKVLDVLANSMDNLAPIVQFDWHGGNNQRWLLQHLGGGEWRIVSVNSGKVLDVFESRADNGTRIVQFDWHGGANQRWLIEDTGDGLSRIVAVHSGRVLDVTGFSHDNLAELIQFDWHGGPNQRFRMEPN